MPLKTNPSKLRTDPPTNTNSSTHANANAPWLVAENVALAQGQQLILQDINFSIQAGDIACLLGASGSGKTTLLRSIAGFHQISRGKIIIAGQYASAPQQCIAPEKRHTGVVFQDSALFPHLTVEKNIAFGLHRTDRTYRQKRVDSMLDLIGLTRLRKRYPHELSGGQQQRVALARALAPKPSIVLMDEPFSKLDPDLREHLVLEVREILKTSKTTAVFVTHDQHEAFAIADYVGVLANQTLVQWAIPHTLYHQPATRYVADFIGEGTFVPGHVLGLSEQQDVLIRPDDVIHDDDSTIQATVINRRFRGAAFLYQVRLDSGYEILSLVGSHHDHPIGSRIGLRFELDHVVSFPRT